jgi:hypothetical protein
MELVSKGTNVLVILSTLVIIVSSQVVSERTPLIQAFVQVMDHAIVTIIVHVQLITLGRNANIQFALVRIYQIQTFVMVVGVALLQTIVLVIKDTQVQSVN